MFIIVIYYTYSKYILRVVLEDWLMVHNFKWCSKPINFKIFFFIQTQLEYTYRRMYVSYRCFNVSQYLFICGGHPARTLFRFHRAPSEKN